MTIETLLGLDTWLGEVIMDFSQISFRSGSWAGEELEFEEGNFRKQL